MHVGVVCRDATLTSSSGLLGTCSPPWAAMPAPRRGTVWVGSRRCTRPCSIIHRSLLSLCPVRLWAFGSRVTFVSCPFSRSA